MENQNIVQMLVSGQKDLKWFDSNIDTLISEFNNKFIAFRNEAVIESDPELEKLIARLKEKDIDTSNIFVKFVSRIKSIL